ncbi:HNH endonuclease [Candidatus Leptofilum sp.]|uniref:HNH endonuclease n=1 Tax=Candidatus Leptofilum sp. TaxID=3241576 RepID=UPI003B5AD46D
MSDLQKYKTMIAEFVPPKGSFKPTKVQDAQKQIELIEEIETNLEVLNKQITSDYKSLKFHVRKERVGKSLNNLYSLVNNDSKVGQKNNSQKNLHNSKLAEYKKLIEFCEKLLKAYELTKGKLIAFIEQELGKKPKRFTASLGGLLNKNEHQNLVNYKAYIRSKEWKLKAEEAKARAGNRCQLCNRSRSEVQLEAHHRTYERLGHELAGDITVLCRDCHHAHEKSKANRELNQNLLEPNKGVCIRCGEQIHFNQHKPFCLSCYKSWTRFRNMTYEEKFCHACGIANPSSMSKPFCLDCYKKSKTNKERLITPNT